MDGQEWWYNNYHKCHHQVLIILMEIMSGYLGRGEPGATVKVHVHGVVIRDVGVDGAGNWATHIGMQPAGRRIEAQQYRLRKTLVWMGRYKCSACTNWSTIS